MEVTKLIELAKNHQACNSDSSYESLIDHCRTLIRDNENHYLKPIEKLVFEFEQTRERLQKLRAVLFEYEISDGNVDYLSTYLLREQEKYMLKYLEILSVRIGSKVKLNRNFSPNVTPYMTDSDKQLAKKRRRDHEQPATL